MVNHKLNKNFKDAFLSLTEVLDWINENLSPEDVFNFDELVDWANEHGYVDEDDVDHEAWAEENGYVLADDPVWKFPVKKAKPVKKIKK